MKLQRSVGKRSFCFFFFNEPAPTEFYPLPLHAPLPIYPLVRGVLPVDPDRRRSGSDRASGPLVGGDGPAGSRGDHQGQKPVRSFCRAAGLVGARELSTDRKSTRLNSSHSQISYAVFCLK